MATGSTPSPLSELTVSAELYDEGDAYRYLEQIRWNGTPEVCPHCGSTGECRFLEPTDGKSRATRTGSRSARRVWRCGRCRRQFSVLTGTVLHGTKVDLLTWLAILGDITAAGVDGKLLPSATSIADRYGVTAETARHVRARLTAALRELSSDQR